MLNQFKARYQDFHRATPHERYDETIVNFYIGMELICGIFVSLQAKEQT
jgi:hypothetical protein